VMEALNVPLDRDWLNGYYQFCNRIAALYFLTHHGVKAHLLFIYFEGDKMAHGGTCPQTVLAWESSLAAQSNWVGLPVVNMLDNRIHKLCLSVCPTGEAAEHVG